MKKLKPIYFYLTYFITNLINAYLLTYALIHPNISSYAFNIDSFVNSFFGNLAVTLLLYGASIIFFLKTKKRLGFLMFCSVILTVLCLGHAIYANIFSTFFKFSQLSSFKNPSQGNFFWFYAQYAFNMLSDFTISIHIIPLIILIVIRIFTDDKYLEYYHPIFKTSTIILSIIFSLIPFVKLNHEINNSIYESSINSLYGVNETGLYNYYLYDLYNYVKKENYKATDEDLDNIKDFLDSFTYDTYVNPLNGKTYSVTNQMTGIAQDKNLIMIQLEAFNNFVIDLTVDGIEITPNLNRLKEKSLYFDRFYSTAGIGNTSDCEFSALTGLYGNGNDLTIFDYSGEHYETLTKDFKQAGYYTFSSHGNYGEFYNRKYEHLHTLGFDEHFDLSYFEEQNDSLPMIHSYLDDKYFFEHFVELMPEEKFFAYGISVTSHSPFVPTVKILQHHFSGLTRLASNYLDFVHYVDEAIGIFIDTLTSRNLLEKSVIVFYGDHTSSLFKSDLESIFQTSQSTVDYRLEMQSVPLIIYNEELFAPDVIDKVTGTVDLYRSLSNLFNLTSKYHFGNDLFTDEPGFIYSPRNLDLIYDDFTYFYPSKTIFGQPQKDVSKCIETFEKYKYINDLILKTKYFK